MSELTIPTHYYDLFKSNLENAIQQTTSLLESKVEVEGGYTGEAAQFIDTLGQVEVIENNNRFGDTPNIIEDHERRWVAPDAWDWGRLIEKQDTLRQLEDPTSKLMMGAVAAFNRQKDRVIMDSMFGAVQTGRKGTVAKTFDTVNRSVGVQVGGSATDVGLNLEKLIEGVELLIKTRDPVDQSNPELFGLITEIQHSDLLRMKETASKEFNLEMVLVDGRVKHFMGIDWTVVGSAIHNFIPVEAVTLHRLIPIWERDAIHLGKWEDFNAQIAKNPQKKFLPQLYASMTIGAARQYDEKIIRIECQE